MRIKSSHSGAPPFSWPPRTTRAPSSGTVLSSRGAARHLWLFKCTWKKSEYLVLSHTTHTEVWALGITQRPHAAGGCHFWQHRCGHLHWTGLKTPCLRPRSTTLGPALLSFTSPGQAWNMPHLRPAPRPRALLRCPSPRLDRPGTCPISGPTPWPRALLRCPSPRPWLQPRGSFAETLLRWPTWPSLHCFTFSTCASPLNTVTFLFNLYWLEFNLLCPC